MHFFAIDSSHQSNRCHAVIPNEKCHFHHRTFLPATIRHIELWADVTPCAILSSGQEEWVTMGSQLTSLHGRNTGISLPVSAPTLSYAGRRKGRWESERGGCHQFSHSHNVHQRMWQKKRISNERTSADERIQNPFKYTYPKPTQYNIQYQ